MQGTVQRVNGPKKTQTGKDMWGINIDGQWFNVFDNPGVSQGDVVSYDTVVKGQYTNLKNLQLVSSGGGSKAPTGGAAGGERDLRIVRQNALGHAINFTMAQLDHPTPNHVIGAAHIFENYVMGVFDEELMELADEFLTKVTGETGGVLAALEEANSEE